MADINVNSSSVSGKPLRRSDKYHTSQAFRYVDTVTGSDGAGNQGTQYFPWATLGHALNNIEDNHNINFAGSETTASIAVSNKSGILVAGEHGATFIGDMTFNSCTNIVIDIDIVGALTFSNCNSIYIQRGVNLTAITATNHDGILDITGGTSCNVTLDGAGTDTEVIVHDNEGGDGKIIWSNSATGSTKIKSSTWLAVENDGTAGNLTTRIVDSYTLSDSFTDSIGSMSLSTSYDIAIDEDDPSGINNKVTPSSKAVTDYVNNIVSSYPEVYQKVSNYGSNITVVQTNKAIYTGIPTSVGGNKYSGRALLVNQPLFYGVDVMQKLTFPDSANASIVDSISVTDGNLVLLSNNELWGWGENASGCLGVGDTSPRYLPELLKLNVVEIMSNYDCSYFDTNTISFFVKDDEGYVWAAGFNGFGVFGLGNTTSSNTWVRLDWIGQNPIGLWQFGSTLGAIKVQTADLSFYTCGYGAGGTNGNGTTTNPTTPVDVSDNWFGAGNKYEILSVAGGSSLKTNSNLSESTVMIAYNDGASWVLKCCGNNSFGQAGQGTTTSRYTTPQIINISGDIKQIVSLGAGGGSRYCLLEDGSLYGWGQNLSGELGVGNLSVTRSPVLIRSNVDEILNTHAGAAAYTNSVSVFVKDDGGATYAAGYNTAGALGIGSSTGAITNFNRVLIDDEIISVGGMFYSNDGRTVTTVFMTSNNRLYASGTSGANAITMKSTSSIISPVRVFIS